MTTWTEELVAVAEAPDTLTAIIETLEGAILPMMRDMLPVPTTEQILVLGRELGEIAGRLMHMGMEIANAS